jgi:hypothetical protein
MPNLVKTSTTASDNFAGWTSGVEGHERPQSAGIIQGSLVKFTNNSTWVTRDEEEISPDRELVPVDMPRITQKWEGGKPVETRVLQPGEKFPDVDALNAAIPREEWEKGPDGQERGPHQNQFLVYLLDLKTMDRFTFATGTVGGSIAISELKDRLVWMRKLRGANVFPVVTLSDVFMNTKFGGRQRPHFAIVRWVRLGGEGASEAPALPAPAEAAPLPEVSSPSMAADDGFLNDTLDDIGTEVAEPPKPAKVTKIGKKRVA